MILSQETGLVSAESRYSRLVPSGKGSHRGHLQSNAMSTRILQNTICTRISQAIAISECKSYVLLIRKLYVILFDVYGLQYIGNLVRDHN